MGVSLNSTPAPTTTPKPTTTPTPSSPSTPSTPSTPTGGTGSGGNVNYTQIGDALTQFGSQLPGTDGEKSEVGELITSLTGMVAKVIAGITDKSDADNASQAAKSDSNKEQKNIEVKAEQNAQKATAQIEAAIQVGMSSIQQYVDSMNKTMEEGKAIEDQIKGDQVKEKEKLQKENEEISKQLEALGVDSGSLQSEGEMPMDKNKKGDDIVGEKSEKLLGGVSPDKQQQAQGLLEKYMLNQQQIQAIDIVIGKNVEDLQAHVDEVNENQQEVADTTTQVDNEASEITNMAIKEAENIINVVTDGLVKSETVNATKEGVIGGVDAGAGATVIATGEVLQNTPVTQTKGQEMVKNGNEEQGAGTKRFANSAERIVNASLDAAKGIAGKILANTSGQDALNSGKSEFAMLFDMASSISTEFIDSASQTIKDAGGGEGEGGKEKTPAGGGKEKTPAGDGKEKTPSSDKK